MGGNIKGKLEHEARATHGVECGKDIEEEAVGSRAVAQVNPGSSAWANTNRVLVTPTSAYSLSCSAQPGE